MKTRRKQETAGVLVVTLILVLALGGGGFGDLAFLSHRKKVALRTAAWNATIPVLEAGIQEALAHLRTDAARPEANCWTSTNFAGQPGYWKRRTTREGMFFLATICNYSNNN